jgi:hypothetical protein
LQENSVHHNKEASMSSSSSVQVPKNFDVKNLLLVGAVVSIATAVALYVAYQKHYQQVLKCHVDTPEMLLSKSCKKMINKSQLVHEMSLEQSKAVCQENEDVMGFDWDPNASVFYNVSQDNKYENEKYENEKCDNRLSEVEGSGHFVACLKIAERKRGYFIGSMVMAGVALVMLIAWLIVWKLS